MEEENVKVYKLTKKEWKNIANSKFGNDLGMEVSGDKCLTVNGKLIYRSMFNLIVSKRDFSLWTKGMKPTRSWQFRMTRDYFGFSGGKIKVQQNCCELLEYIEIEQSIYKGIKNR